MRSVPLLFVIIFYTNIAVEAATLTVSIYYESLCPDSVRFFKDQFYPAYSTVLKGKIIVDLVPFGKATAKNETGKWVFDCQHGKSECYGNKIHGCAIDVATKDTSTEFIVCAMKSGDASDNNNLKQCAADNNITWSNIEQCMGSNRGDEILASNGERTRSVQPKITFIPTIIFNYQMREQLQKLALKDFHGTVEFLLEDEDCSKCQNGGRIIGLSWCLIAFCVISIFT
ncbi:GILT-like protein 1 [Diorhabda carinulata]|uniref:GILT-like protein 1 n=1 Tax=Diorhabda carinulata TaxID=1163345 RepID=UPI0025A2F9E9|nr:GILT-like protein 1 [Diorhabda carinulata]